MVTPLLTARRFQPLFAKRRSSYVPGRTDSRTVRLMLPLSVPVVYFHATKFVSGEPVGTSATQSVGLGAPMFDHVAVKIPPRATVAGLAVRLAATTVSVLLTARRCHEFCAKKRRSYVPGGTASGTVKLMLPLPVPVVDFPATQVLSGA